MDAAQIRRAQRQWILMLVGASGFFFGMAAWMQRDLARLSMEGRRVPGRIIDTWTSNGDPMVRYAYVAAGEEYEMNATRAPSPVGTAIEVVYLPSWPRASWPDRPPTAGEISGVGAPCHALAGLLAGLTLAFLLSSEIGRRRVLAGRAEPSAAIGGRMLWLCMTGAVVGAATLDARCGQVLDRAFRLDELGIPTLPIRAVALVLMALPGAWVTTDLMALSVARPLSALSRGGFLLWLFGPGPAAIGLGVARRRVLAGLAAYLALGVAWIVFAAVRRV